MNIARILTRLNLGGPARQVLASDPNLLKRGYEITVYAGSPEPGEGDLRGELANQGVRVVSVPYLGRKVHPWRDRRALQFLRAALAEQRPDVVHTHASKAGVLGRRVA
ncbi:MAG TPA: glycosyltransferase, partial [Planctomycetota bacterium]|nr:glycosyltransferase [Planctomycetota bacterium]